MPDAVEVETVDGNDTAAIGAAETQEFTYTPVAEGECTLDFVFCRTWEIDSITNANGTLNYSAASDLEIPFTEKFVNVKVFNGLGGAMSSVGSSSKSGNSIIKSWGKAKAQGF